MARDNTAKRNSSGMLGKKHTEESKLKMSISGKGKHNHNGKNNPCYGKVWTEEERKKQSEAHKGQVPWDKGIKRTDLQNTQVLYKSPITGEMKTRQEWLSLGVDVYYRKYLRVGRLRDIK